MATPVQTAQMIRLALGSLAADNEHHSFEHLCRQVAKRRIASNVVPATGPVSAGGDQGRDFETFRTYLADELPFALGFLALASSDVVVFACTIQRDGLRAKFEDDIKSICTQGTPRRQDLHLRHRERSDPGCGTTCKSGPRGSMTSCWRSSTGRPWQNGWPSRSCTGSPRSTCTCPPSSHPRSTQPRARASYPPWYAELRAYWQEPSRQPVTLGDLFDLRHGLRYAIPPGPARADLAGWLSLMTLLAEASPYPEARLHAIYEITAARIRAPPTYGPPNR